MTVLLQPMRLVDWGVLEQMLLLQRKKSTLLEDLPPEIQDGLVEEVKLDRSVPLQELITYASSREGASWRLWLSLRQTYSHWQCANWIDTLIAQGRLGEYLAVSLQIDGLDLFADLDWPRFPYDEELRLLQQQKTRGEQGVDWKVHTNAVAEVYHISPREFGLLTYYQARVLLWDREALKGRLKLSNEEMQQIMWLRRMRASSTAPTDAPSNAT